MVIIDNEKILESEKNVLQMLEPQPLMVSMQIQFYSEEVQHTLSVTKKNDSCYLHSLTLKIFLLGLWRS